MPPVPLSTDLITFRCFEYAVFGKEAHQGFEVVTVPRLRVTGENIVQLRLRLSHFDSSVFYLPIIADDEDDRIRLLGALVGSVPLPDTAGVSGNWSPENQ